MHFSLELIQISKYYFMPIFFFIFLKCFWLFNLKRFLRNPKLHWYNLRLSRYFLHFASSYTLLFKTLTNMLCASYYVNIIFWVGIWSVIKVWRKKIWKELILTWRFSAIVSLDSANLKKISSSNFRYGTYWVLVAFGIHKYDIFISEGEVQKSKNTNILNLK